MTFSKLDTFLNINLYQYMQYIFSFQGFTKIITHDRHNPLSKIASALISNVVQSFTIETRCDGTSQKKYVQLFTLLILKATNQIFVTAFLFVDYLGLHDLEFLEKSSNSTDKYPKCSQLIERQLAGYNLHVHNKSTL